MPILPCQALFGMSRGARLQQAIEEDTGEECPCVQGRVCPLVGIALPQEWSREVPPLAV